MHSMLRTAFIVLLGAALGGLALMNAGLLLEPFEHRLLFSPRPVDREWLHSLTSGQRGIEEVRILTPDGVTLHGWLKRPAREGRAGPGKRHPLVIVYGGARREISEFVRRADGSGEWAWLMVNYRGFGLSEGSASERLVVEDAKRVYDWAAARPDVDPASIVVLGRSLGTYVAVAVASTRHARAAILATPFDSFVALGEKRFPSLPVDWLVGGRYDPASIAPRVRAPALFLIAEDDDVTPAENGRALARQWGGLTKTVLLRGAGHYGIERRDEFWRSVGEFLISLKKINSSSQESSRSRSSAR
jgi:uncharacterized protein